MDSNKVGAFIALCRKEKKLTQKQLGEKLNVTDRAVSKWETGRSFPDVSLLEPLSQELGISVSELLAGKKIEPEQYQQETEKMLMASVSAGQLMGFQIVIYVISFATVVLVDMPFLIKHISGFPLINYMSIFCWILAVVLMVCVDYLDKKMPARKFRTSNVKIETLMGGLIFAGIMIVDFIISGGINSFREIAFSDKILSVVMVVGGLIIAAYVRRIMAKTRREEWDMEQEQEDKSGK